MALERIPTLQEVKDWVNNNADVPHADYADSAGDAETLDGNHPDELGSVASNADDGSDLTHYTVSLTQSDGTLVDISGSGTCQMGRLWTTADVGDDTAFTITVDGGPTWTIDYVSHNISGADVNSASHLPPIEFSSSITIDYHTHGNNTSGEVWVKQ